MYGQKRLTDGIRSFSPPRENWVSKPAEELPEKVTVSFKTGQTGILDMKNPRAVHWAEIIDRLERANRPVYVEVDEEYKVITKVLIPRVYKVKTLEPNEQGDIRVRLDPSAAVHLLLQSDPDHEAMRAKLQTALDDDSELLITETRDEHEIIDVRPPPDTAGGPPDPTPSPPIDPPVSEARAQVLYNDMNAKSCVPCSPGSDCIPFLYPDNGCWIRAHKMCYLMTDDGEDPEKVWIRGNLVVPTPNHPDCMVSWWYHVAPILTLDTPGNPKTVIDPSVSPTAESEAAWQNRQGDSNSTLDETVWTQYGPYGGTATLQQTDQDLVEFRDDLKTRCDDFGPPPYNCTRRLFFIIDRNTFSDDEIEAMLHASGPANIANINAAFYIVSDGFSPNDLGFTSATMQVLPTLNISPNVSGMAITPDRVEFEDPTHLNRRQRVTWVYNISFTDITGFTINRRTVTLDATISGESSTGYLYLIKQPNPYEVDGPTSWLSTDLRVFQIDSGQSKFGVTMGSDPNAFITQVINNLNTGNTGGQTFENDISLDQQTSRLEISQTVGGTPVYNFAVAKVRYRSLVLNATDVRVFFRLFPVASSSLAYDQATVYRRHVTGGTVIPLLGIKNNEVASIPCFASPRINSSVASMTTQTDTPNVQNIPPDTSGAEVTQYFACWLDINQTQPQFPIQPSPVDGQWASSRKTIQELVRNEHQCLVSEIAFTPAPAQSGSTPSVSDKLAQRNLAIVAAANPGLAFSRRVPQTFEVRPSISKPDHDELMIDWGNVPVGSIATVYLPGIDTNDILLLASKKYRSHRLVRIDEHTLKFDTGGITYLPLPFADGNFPGMLTVDLPEGIEKGQAFTIVVRQVTSEQQLIATHRLKGKHISLRHILGSFQLTIPVREKAEMLPAQQRLLSNLRWIERAIPANNRWSRVFGKYVKQIADRTDALGGDSSRVAASPSGQWRQAYRNCLVLTLATILLIAMLVVVIGALPGGLAMVGILVLALLIGTVRLWLNKCRPRTCQLLRVLLAGSGIGTIILALLAVFGVSTLQLITTLIVSAGITALTAIVSWEKGCFE